MDIKKEREAFDVYFKEKYPELYKDVFNEDGDDRAIIGYSFALSAWLEAKQQAVPDGFVVAPNEPTRAMEIAGMNAGAGFVSRSIYKAMIQEAQK